MFIFELEVERARGLCQKPNTACSSPSSSTPPPPPFSFHVHITVSLSYGSLSLCRCTHATCFQNGYPRRSRGGGGGGGGPDCVCVPLPLLRLPGITRVPRSPLDDAATSSSTSMRIWQSGGGRARVRAAAGQPTPLCFYVLSKAERTSERRRREAAAAGAQGARASQLCCMRETDERTDSTTPFPLIT